MDLLASEGYLNVERDSLELRFQVRASTFFQRCRDQQYYINQLLKKQWHQESEIKQLKERLKRELSKTKHHSNSTNANNGSSITEISPISNTATSTITVGENCQLISVNLASTSSSSATSYSTSSSASDTTDIPSYSDTKSKSIANESKYTSKKSNHHSSSHKSNSKSNSKDKSSSRYEHLCNEHETAEQNIYMNTNRLIDKHENVPTEGKLIFDKMP